jgi:hypothetical protein
MEFSIVMTIEFKSNKPNKTYQNHTKNIRQSKQKNSQFISTEAKLKDFKGEQNRTYRKKKSQKRSDICSSNSDHLIYEQSIYAN